MFGLSKQGLMAVPILLVIVYIVVYVVDIEDKIKDYKEYKGFLLFAVPLIIFYLSKFIKFENNKF